MHLQMECSELFQTHDSHSDFYTVRLHVLASESKRWIRDGRKSEYAYRSFVKEGMIVQQHVSFQPGKSPQVSFKLLQRHNLK